VHVAGSGTVSFAFMVIPSPRVPDERAITATITRGTDIFADRGCRLGPGVTAFAL
jgi:hypothetical protein